MSEPAKTRIVVADDDVDIPRRTTWSSKLTQAGFETVADSDGVAALEAIEADLPRLAILDILFFFLFFVVLLLFLMPGMTFVPYLVVVAFVN